MVAHTGFLTLARRLTPGVEPLQPTRRPVKAAYSEAPAWKAEYTKHTVSERRLRRVCRNVTHRADVEETRRSEAGHHGRVMEEKIEAEVEKRAREGKARKQGGEGPAASG